MIDLYTSRRNNFFRCLYWKRDESGVMDNNKIILSKKPDGVFYAKLVAEKEKGEQDIANVVRVPYQLTTIQTEDIVDLHNDDLVFFNNSKWIVEGVRETIIQKNSEFSAKTSKISNIIVRKE